MGRLDKSLTRCISKEMSTYNVVVMPSRRVRIRLIREVSLADLPNPNMARFGAL
jgi:hypothetical protein